MQHYGRSNASECNIPARGGTDAGVCLWRVGAVVVTSVANEEEEGNIGDDGGGGKKARNERGRRKEKLIGKGHLVPGALL